MITLGPLQFIRTLATFFVWVMPLSAMHADEATRPSGPSTNGIYASAEIIGNIPGSGHHIEITIHFTAPHTNPARGVFLTTGPETNGVAKVFDPSSSWVYFAPTNSFCGLIALADDAGRKIPVLKPEVNKMEAYPRSFKLGEMRKNGIAFWRGPALPRPLAGANVPMGFPLEKYYKLKKNGTYQLTVWPIIYKRLSTNDDLCVRMDLAPVTIPVDFSRERPFPK